MIRSFLVGVALLSIAAQASADGIVAQFETYAESSYGYGVNGDSVLALWDTQGECFDKDARYVVTDKSGRETSSGCWTFDDANKAVILQGKGSMPAYLFRRTEYAARLNARNHQQ